MKKRMNLFREIGQPAASPAVAVKGKRSFALSVHLLIAAFTIVAIGGGLGSSYVSFKKNMAEFQHRIQEAETELTQSLSQLDQIAKTKTQTEERRTPAGYDGSWASIMWKVAMFTPGQEITLDSVELSKPGSATTARSLVLKGNARTLGAIRTWLERLGAQMPGFEFVMERQGANSKETAFPLNFHVTAGCT